MWPGDPTSDSPGSALQSSTTSTLLLGVRTHDPEAWRRLTTLFGPVVHGWCMRGGLQPEEAADVGQEVFQAVATGIARFERATSGQTFRGWLWGITQNKLRDHWRRRARQPDAAGGSEAHRMLAEVPDPELSESESQADVSGVFRRALEMIRANFEERTWQAFWRLTIDERTAAEVSKELGMSTGAVYVAKSRVLSRLREELGDLLE